MTDGKRYIRFFRELTIDDVSLVGGKNASLGEMYRELTPNGIKVPNGFAITAEAYRDMLAAAAAWDALHDAMDDLNPDDMGDLRAVAPRRAPLSTAHRCPTRCAIRCSMPTARCAVKAARR